MAVCGGVLFSLNDARIVCRMLGYDGVLEAGRLTRFGHGSGGILFVDCSGSEESLVSCYDVSDATTYCEHKWDAGAICYSGDPFKARLVGGSNDAEGRVEVLYNGSWGTVCSISWDLRDAWVVCTLLGFIGALEAPKSAKFSEGYGPILLDWVECYGTEDSLADCNHRGVGDWSYCGHDRDAGAICHSGDPFEVRLAGGSNKKGRVEVFYNGSWGTICDDDWDLRDARVVCRMLGFDGALEAPRSARFGQGSGRVLLTWVGCDGTEDNLADCIHRGVGDWSYCDHDRDAGVICYSGANPNPFQVRLVGGSNDAEGRVEVMHNGSWGTICDDDWDLRDARVVCKMLGFDGALEAPRSARFGQGSGHILLNYVNCEGTEDNQADCAHPGIGRYSYSCSHARDAGAICLSEIRLDGGLNDAEGIVEILHDGSWGTICDDDWDLRDVRVVCRMLGFDGALEAPRSARFGHGSGPIHLLFVGCDGTEDNLADCSHVGIGRFSCSQSRNAGAICFSRVSNGSSEFETYLSNKVHGDPFLWLVICIPVLSSMGLAAFLFCLYQRRTKRSRSSDTITYMDLMHSRTVSHQDLNSTYQDLSSPPNLPQHSSADVSVYYKSQIASTEGEDTTNVSHEYTDLNTILEKQTISKDSERKVYMETGKKSGEAYYENRISVQRKTENSTQDAVQKYMDMRPIAQRISDTPDTGFDDYLLATPSNMSKSCVHLSEGTPISDVAGNGNSNVQDKGNKYMDMNIVYQTPASGSDLDVDGYLLHDITSANTDQDIDKHLLRSLTSAKNKVILNDNAVSTGFANSRNELDVKEVSQSSGQNHENGEHDYMDIESPRQDPKEC
nr:deleted in malignant brain tumors 1 protein-like [Lytechinus pictus]